MNFVRTIANASRCTNPIRYPTPDVHEDDMLTVHSGPENTAQLQADKLHTTLLLRTVVLRSSTDAVLALSDALPTPPSLPPSLPPSAVREPSGKRTSDVDGGEDLSYPGVVARLVAEDGEVILVWAKGDAVAKILAELVKLNNLVTKEDCLCSTTAASQQPEPRAYGHDRHSVMLVQLIQTAERYIEVALSKAETLGNLVDLLCLCRSQSDRIQSVFLRGGGEYDRKVTATVLVSTISSQSDRKIYVRCQQLNHGCLLPQPPSRPLNDHCHLDIFWYRPSRPLKAIHRPMVMITSNS
ncbi:hypothetical protein PTMSG1_02853 [Pyrenophora teres f. maculata]|nr:hypothetical protein PTMSG1_02853 [Pyrenophora teres f. maculata]